MNKPNFIELTLEDNTPIIVNINHITSAKKGMTGTLICMLDNDDFFIVREDYETIKKLLDYAKRIE